MRTLVLTGPGGAGSSTLAAAAAVRAAAAGRSTLLLTRQAAPVAGLGDVPGLEVRTVDAGAAVERFWAETVAPAATSLPQVLLPPSSSVTPLPGAADLALFAELGRAQADLVVVDAGPPAEAVALLALPATLRWWLDRLLPPGARALGALRTAAVSSGAAAAVPWTRPWHSCRRSRRCSPPTGWPTRRHRRAAGRRAPRRDGGVAARAATALGAARPARRRRPGPRAPGGRAGGVVARAAGGAGGRAPRARRGGPGAPHRRDRDRALGRRRRDRPAGRRRAARRRRARPHRRPSGSRAAGSCPSRCRSPSAAGSA